MTSFDEALEKVGSFGPYQKRIYFLVCLCHVLTGFHMVIAVFLTGTPQHRCAIPGYENDTFAIQGQFHRQLINITIPPSTDNTLEYDECHVINKNGSMVECQDWVYDKSVYKSTFTSEQNLVCQDKLKTSHARLIFFGGVFVGAFGLGALSDSIGRRKTLWLSLFGLFASSLSVAFSPNFWVFCALRFLVGFFCAGVIMTSYVLGVEIVGAAGRLWTGIIIQMFFSIGFIILSGIGYGFRYWKYIEITCSVPVVLYLSYWWLLPESPRWLVTHGRLQEATQILKMIAHKNGMPDPGDDILKGVTTTQSKQGKLWHVLSTRVLFIRTSIIFFNWMVVSMVYYGLSLNTDNLGGDFYLNFFISGLVEIPAYVICLLVLERIGRRRFHAFCMIFGGLACISTIFTTLYADESLSAVGVTLAMLGKIGASAAFAVIYIWSAELYPTVARNAAMGASSGFARVGGMIAPYIASLNKVISGDVGKATPLLVFGGVSVIAGVLSLLLPETLGRTLPETVEDSKNFTKKAKASVDKTVVVAYDNSGFEHEKGKNGFYAGISSDIEQPNGNLQNSEFQKIVDTKL